MKLADSLNTLLADTVTFYFFAHGCHWNVEGADFYQYHQLFQDLYEDVYSSIDPLAENVRKLGSYTLFNLGELEGRRTLRIAGVAPSTLSMAAALLAANQTLTESLRDCFTQAANDDEQGIANFLADRIDHHQKWTWMLTAATKGQR